MSKSIAEPEYVFAIYSCKKNISKAINMYNTYLNGKFPITIKFFIICGNKINTNYVIQNDLLILNVGDDYENLTNKTVTLFKTILEIYPNIKGCFKCDDDIIPNINAIYSFLYKLTLYDNIDYSGKGVLYNYFTDKENRINKTDEINLKEFLKNEKHFRYCAGPMYYLSNKSMQTFTQPNIQFLNQEDIAVGYHLQKNNILIHDNNIFSDALCKINTNSYHNRQHKPILYINLSGGLGNQMFQIASAYGIMRKLNMHLVAIKYNCNNIHNKVVNYFENNIFDKVAYIEDADRSINF